MNVHVLAGPAGTGLGTDLARALGANCTVAKSRVFPDGETCCVADLPRGGRALIIVQGTAPPQDTNVLQLLQLVDVGRHAGFSPIICVVPYLAYARQDRRSAVGEPISVQVVLRAIAAAGADELVTVEAHNPHALCVAGLRVTSLSAASAFADFLARKKPTNPIILSPDQGGARRAEDIAEILGWPSVAFNKRKDAVRGTWYGHQDADLRGRDVFVIDDLCSSGSTLVPIAQHARANGARRIAFGVVHFFADPSSLQERLNGAEIFYADTIPGRGAKLAILPLIAGHFSNFIQDSSAGMLA